MSAGCRGVFTGWCWVPGLLYAAVSSFPAVCGLTDLCTGYVVCPRNVCLGSQKDSSQAHQSPSLVYYFHVFES